MTHSFIFSCLVLNLVNLLFKTSHCWKWPASCHIFVKWPVSKNHQLDRTGLGHSGLLALVNFT